MVFSSAWQMPKERVRISGVCWEKGLAVIFHLKWHKCRCKQIIQESCRFFSIPSSNIHPKCLAFFGHRIQESLGRERDIQSICILQLKELSGGISWWKYSMLPQRLAFSGISRSLWKEKKSWNGLGHWGIQVSFGTSCATHHFEDTYGQKERPSDNSREYCLSN